MEVNERGEKHRCMSCQTLFYDLKRPALICPRCGMDQVEAARLAAAAPKRARKRAAKKPVPAPVAAAKEEEPAVDEDVDEDDGDAEALDRE